MAVPSATHKGFYYDKDNDELQILFNGTEQLAINSTGLSLFQAAPAAQQSDVGALTDNTGGTADGTVADVGGTFSQSTLNNNFADLIEKINDIRTALRNLGLMA